MGLKSEKQALYQVVKDEHLRIERWKTANGVIAYCPIEDETYLLTALSDDETRTVMVYGERNDKPSYEVAMYTYDDVSGVELPQP